MRAPGWRRLVGGALVASALATGGVALVTGGHAPATADGGPAVDARDEAMSHFAIFAARRGDAAEPPPAVVAAAERSGLEASDVRAAHVPLGWPELAVTPQADALCVYADVDGLGGGCTPWADALAGRAYMTLSGGPDMDDGEAVVLGIVPDETTDVELVDASGTRTLAVNGGFYYAETTDPVRVTITAPSGTSETIDLAHLPGSNE